MKKSVRLLCAVLVFVLCFTVSAHAATDNPVDMPYESYIYNYDNEPLNIPSPYVIEKTITAADMGVAAFTDLADVFYDHKDRLYFTDTASNRVIITDLSYKLVGTISTFDNGGTEDTLYMPKSVFANSTYIYVADTENNRIVVFDRETLKFAYALGRPDIAILADDFIYKPTSLTVDNAGRLYVIADGINQGLICLDEKGNFQNFLGAPSVEYNFLDLMWRKFQTKEQQKQTQQFVPTEYTKMLIDERGFIYAVAASSTTSPVAKLNSQGNNVLSDLNNESEYGDITYTTLLGSQVFPDFCDLTLDDTETYYLLDSQNGRIYAYSSDGYLLFVFGASGSQSGTFLSPSAIEIVNDRLIVTDRVKNAVFTFNLTQFGSDVLSALTLYDEGDYEAATKMWQKVYNTSSNYTLSIIGLAKIDIQNGEYKAAMERVEPIHEYTVYSKAFAEWRDEWIRDNFFLLIIAIVALAVLAVVALRIVRRKKLLSAVTDTPLYREFRYGNHVMFHPFDGFWDIKREKRGSARAATIILVLFTLLYAVRAQFTGYMVTQTASEDKNAIYDVIMILLPLLLWIISNWCFTALMDGEGNMKDIYIATCYSLKPYIFFSIPLLLISQFVTADEVIIYTVLDTICWVWMLALVFFGMMVTHDYSLSKSVLTVILTIVGICLIIFIMLLFVSIVQEVYTFFYNGYQELIFRTY